MKITWGHGVIIALGAFILFILGMIFLFPLGKQNSELITENYYEEELQYQNVIDAKKRADDLADKPHIEITQNGIKFDFPKDISNENSTFKFYLFRTNDRNLDIEKKVTLNPDNTLFIPAEVLVKGSYTLKLMWKKANLDYQIDYDIQWK